MKKLNLAIFAVIAVIGITALSYADIPRVINYQGKFTDKENNPLTGNYLVTFTVTDTAGLSDSETITITVRQKTSSGSSLYQNPPSKLLLR